jgi:hypothetical protein
MDRYVSPAVSGLSRLTFFCYKIENFALICKVGNSENLSYHKTCLKTYALFA